MRASFWIRLNTHELQISEQISNKKSGIKILRNTKKKKVINGTAPRVSQGEAAAICPYVISSARGTDPSPPMARSFGWRRDAGATHPTRGPTAPSMDPPPSLSVAEI